MSNHKELLKALFQHTKIMHEALENKNMDVVFEMLRKRDDLIERYRALGVFEPDKDDQAQIDELLQLDHDNNVLLEVMVEKEYEKIAQASKKKNEAKKNSSAIKKYVYGTFDAKSCSKFNKKT
ncbi:MAG: hypothetical protein JXO44_15200 [Clostridia bacterium]|nr:hypothetical protein [Clostridia bacterium]